MNVIRVLDEIERLAGSIVNLPQCERAERTHAYTTIRVLIQELEELTALGGKAEEINEQLQKLKWSCRTIAGLDQDGGQTDSQHLAGIRETIKVLQDHCGETKTQA